MTPHRYIAQAARGRYGNRCPVCAKPMQFKTPPVNRPTPRDTATRGHDYAVAFGGNKYLWVSMCWSCNQEQATRDLVTWARHLEYAGDPRALPALELAVFIRKWASERGYKSVATVQPVPIEILERLRLEVSRRLAHPETRGVDGGVQDRPADT